MEALDDSSTPHVNQAGVTCALNLRSHHSCSLTAPRPPRDASIPWWTDAASDSGSHHGGRRAARSLKPDNLTGNKGWTAAWRPHDAYMRVVAVTTDPADSHFCGIPAERQPLPPSETGHIGRACLGEEVTLERLWRCTGKSDREVYAMVGLWALLAANARVATTDPSGDSKQRLAARWRICAEHALERERAWWDVASDHLVGDGEDQCSDPVIVDHMPGAGEGIVRHVVLSMKY